MRTAPVPNLPPIPGMCPGTALSGGGGDGGGGSGKGAGSGGEGAGNDATNGSADAAGDEKASPDPNANPKCGTKAHPVDVVTGRAFTHPIVDFELPGPLPLRFTRVCSSKTAKIDVGLGFGWSHCLGWKLAIKRRYLRIWTDQGTVLDFKIPKNPGDELIGAFGWVIRRANVHELVVDTDDGTLRHFVRRDESSEFELASVADVCGNAITLLRSKGRIVEIIDSVGRRLHLRQDRHGRVASIEAVTAADGRTHTLVRYTYDEIGHLVSVIDPDGFQAHYTYDKAHRLVTDTDRTGLTFHFVYDKQGRCTESWGDYPGRKDPSLSDSVDCKLADRSSPAKGIHHCLFHYYPEGLTEVVDSTRVSSFFGNARGTLDKEVDGPGVSTYKYDERGHLIAEEDGVGATTTYERDVRGRMLSQTDPLGRTTRYELDSSGKIVQITDPKGGVTQISRDRFGQMEIVSDPAGGSTSYRYDERGMRTSLVAANGGETRFEYDAHANVTSVVLATGSVWVYTYDSLGRRLSEIDPTGGETKYVYSARGDLIESIDAEGGVTRFLYDGEGHLIQTSDPAGRTTSFEWGGYHKVVSRKDANGASINLRYNREGELLEVFNERGEVHRMLRDTFGQLIGEETFDGRVLRYRNDALSRPVRIEKGSGKSREITEFTYDLAGQMVGRELPDGSLESFAYDALGQLVSAKNDAGEVLFERDVLGNVVAEIQRFGGKEHRITAKFNPYGDRIEMRTSLGFRQENTYDGLGDRVVTILDGRDDIAHTRDELGREIRRTLPGGGLLDSAYDGLGRLSERRVMDGSTHRDVTVHRVYRHNAAGELTQDWDQTRGSTTYEYDPVGQLLAAVPEEARSEVFRYDVTGNLYEHDGFAADSAPRRVYGPGNRLLEKDNTRFTWDDHGRLLEERKTVSAIQTTSTPSQLRVVDNKPIEEVTRYVWNGAGLLSEVFLPDGSHLSFVYDALGRRISKSFVGPKRGLTNPNRSRTRFVWDEDVLVHAIREEAKSSGDVIVHERTYSFEPNSFVPLAQRDGSPAEPWFQFVNDTLGTPLRLVDSHGDVACEVQRSAWGEVSFGVPNQGRSARTTTDICGQGELRDEETGLFYNRFRYYSPALGGFISADPIGLLGGTHSYAYPGARQREVDPLGLGPSLEEIRANYNAEVTGIEAQAQKRICDGESPLAASKWAVEERKRIGKKYKHLTPLHKRIAIYARNIAPKWMGGAGYATIYGPSHEQQMRKYGGNPHEVIAASSRPNKKINARYGVK